MNNTINFGRLVALAILSYVLLILGNGYVFGHLGMIETLPYQKVLLNPSLYPNDFYLDGIQESFPNVRWPFVQMMSVLSLTNPWAVFISHFIVSLVLILGILKITMLYVEQITTAFWAMMLTLLVLYNHNLGGNELYYNNLSPSLVAKSLSIWAVYYFLFKHYSLAFILLIPASFIHPMVGIQLFLLFFGVLFFLSFGKERSLRKMPILAIVSYLLTSGIWILYLKSGFFNETIDSSKIFEILKFRLAHHYFPSTYPMKEYLILIPLFLLSWVYFWKHSRSIFLFYTLVFFGLIVYTIGVEFTEVMPLLSAQWFKTTIWIKLFSSIALAASMEKFIFTQAPKIRQYQNVITIVIFCGLATFLWIRLPQRHPLTLDIPWKEAYNDRINIALLAKAKTPREALFITPSDFSHLKYYGERSTYVDYKATIHVPQKLIQWYERVGEVYIGKSSSSHGRLVGALKITEDLEYLKFLGITHVLTKQKLNEHLVGEAGDYRIYALE